MKKYVRMLRLRPQRITPTKQIAEPEPDSSKPLNWQKIMMKNPTEECLKIRQAFQKQQISVMRATFVQNYRQESGFMAITAICAEIVEGLPPQLMEQRSKLLTRKILQHVQSRDYELLVRVYGAVYFATQKIIDMNNGIHEALVIVSETIYDRLPHLHKEMAVYLCLKLNLANKLMIKKFLIQCQTQPTYEAMSYPKDQTYFLYLRITNMAFLEEILPKQQFLYHFQIEQYEKLIQKYLGILSNPKHMIPLKMMYINNARPYMIFKLPFTTNLPVTNNIKTQLAKFMATFEPSINLYHDYKVYVSLFLIFNSNDRFLLKEFLYNNMYDETIKEFRLLNLQMLTTFRSQHKCIMLKQLYILNQRCQSKFDQDFEEIMTDFRVLFELGCQSMVHYETSDQMKYSYECVKTVFCGLVELKMREFSRQKYKSCCMANTLNQKLLNKQVPTLEPMLSDDKGEGEIPLGFFRHQTSEQQPDYKKISQQNRQVITRLLRTHKITKIFPYNIETQYIKRVDTIGQFLKQVALLIKIHAPKLTSIQKFKQQLNSLEGIQAISRYICLPGVVSSLIRIDRSSQKLYKVSIFEPTLRFIIDRAVIRFEKALSAPFEMAVTALSRNPQFKLDPLYKPSAIKLLSQPCPPFIRICYARTSRRPMFINTQKNIFNQRFTLSLQNILSNIYTSNIGTYCIETSELKSQTEIILINQGKKMPQLKIRKNVVKYPYFADFLIDDGKKIKVAIFCIDYAKRYFGIDSHGRNNSHIEISESISYFTSNSWRILSLSIGDIDLASQNPKILRKIKATFK